MMRTPPSSLLPHVLPSPAFPPISQASGGGGAKPVVVEVYDGGVLRELADNPQQFKEIVADIFKVFNKDSTPLFPIFPSKPVVVEVYDGGVLRELADNPQQFKEIVSDIFREFDEDGSGTLSRLELKPAFVSLGLVPPSAHTEVDALLSRVIGKYGGSDLQVDEGEFELMLGDMVKELSEELACRPIILSAEKKPVFTGSFVRQLTGDRNHFDAVASQLFMEWDILHRGRLSRTEIILGFKKYTSSFEVQLLTPGEAEELCARVFSKADEDQSGFVEFDEFDGVLKELLNGMAKKLDRNPVVTTS
ncbi:unnamed protein product, partial [Closterium sp. Naga37s-1]